MTGEDKTQNKFLISLLATTPEKKAFLDQLYFLPKRLASILQAIKSFGQSKIFLSKVSKKEAPNYYNIIKKPMDLSTVQKKIGIYKSFEEFKEDLDLIWNNCLEYNEGKYYRDCAIKMKELVSTLEIERIPAPRDPELPATLGTIEGNENNSQIAKHAVRKLICKALLSSGYSFVSKAALEVFSDVFRHKIIKIIRRELCED